MNATLFCSAHSKRLILLSLLPALLSGLATCAHATSVVASERVYSGASFVDSVGINVHLHYTDTPYVQRWPEVRDLLVNSKIRHIRDGLIDTSWAGYYQHINELSKLGFRMDLITSVGSSRDSIAAALSKLSGVESLEGPNEADLSKRPDWVADVRNTLPQLRVGSEVTGRSMSVVGPSFTSAAAYAAAGDLSPLEDYGNMHDYPGGRNPGTGGWGLPAFGSRYGSLAYNIAVARQSAGERPIISTETGYCTNLGIKQCIPESVESRYLPRLLLEHFLSGVKRTYIYELLDEGPTASSQFGIVAGDLNPKPAYWSVKGTLDAIGGLPPLDLETVSAGPQITVVSDEPDLHHVLFQRNKETFALAIWRELEGYDVVFRSPRPISTCQVSIKGVRASSRPTAFLLDDAGQKETVAVNAATDGASISVDDHVTFVIFTFKKGP